MTQQWSLTEKLRLMTADDCADDSWLTQRLTGNLCAVIPEAYIRRPVFVHRYFPSLSRIQVATSRADPLESIGTRDHSDQNIFGNIRDIPKTSTLENIVYILKEDKQKTKQDQTLSD